MTLLIPTVVFRSGFLFLGSGDDQFDASKSYANDVALGLRASKYDSRDPIPRTVFPQGVNVGPKLKLKGTTAVLNLDSGWATAARAVEMLLARAIALGGKVIGGKTVTGLIREDDGRTRGVALADGSSIHASLVVIASGSWTASTFRELELGKKCLSTG